MQQNNKRINYLHSIKSLAATIVIISIVLISSCTKRECRGSVARPVLKIKLKKLFYGGGNTIVAIKDTFLRITSIEGIDSINDTLLINKPENSKDSLNILSLPLSPLYDTTSFIISWKDSNTASPKFRNDRVKFTYTRYQVQTSELCGFTYYFKNLNYEPLPSIKNNFERIDILKPTLNLVNDTIHAYVYLQ